MPAPGAPLQHPVLGLMPPHPATSTPSPAAPSQPFAVSPTTPTNTSALVGPGEPTAIAAMPPIFGPAVMFLFDRKHIAALKAQANLELGSYNTREGSDDDQEPITFVSSNDAVSARMWQVCGEGSV